jgi:flagellar hook-length control protein FliK
MGVIPPRIEQSSFPEKKTENLKDKKSEFESILNQSSRPSKKADKKEKSDQALGGTKKKVQDTDQKLVDKSEKTKKGDNETETEGVDKKRKQKLVNEEMVLGSMASVESANKTPDSEVNPDNLEKTNLPTIVEAKVTASAEVSTSTPETSQISDAALATLVEAQQQGNASPDQNLFEVVATPLEQIQNSMISGQEPPDVEAAQPAVETQSEIETQPAVQTQFVEQAQPKPESQFVLKPQSVAQAQSQVEARFAVKSPTAVETQAVNEAQAGVQAQPQVETKMQAQVAVDQVQAKQDQRAPEASILAQAQVQTDKVQTLEIPVQPQLQVEVAPEVKVSDIVPDSKILETLNREHVFQKLETLKKTEVPLVKAESRNTMDGISIAQPIVQAKTSTAFESADQGQDQLNHEDNEAVQLGTVPQNQSHVAKDFASISATTQINKPDVTKDTEAANLKEILNQAQYLVTKGGGEVSVKMTPEGMGEVQLKIMMENGKMNLEMNTQDKNVQKLIQDSLSDLKSSLAAHQISVDHVTLNNKISTVYEAQNTSSAQNFTDAHAHHQSQHSHQRDQRQQAGQVLEHETMKALPLAKNEINKASAHRVYQNNKANSLNAVA